MTVKQRLSRSNIYMFLIPLLIVGVWFALGVAVMLELEALKKRVENVRAY